LNKIVPDTADVSDEHRPIAPTLYEDRHNRSVTVDGVTQWCDAQRCYIPFDCAAVEKILSSLFMHSNTLNRKIGNSL